jgi:hypothetical protein
MKFKPGYSLDGEDPVEGGIEEGHVTFQLACKAGFWEKPEGKCKP